MWLTGMVTDENTQSCIPSGSIERSIHNDLHRARVRRNPSPILQLVCVRILRPSHLPLSLLACVSDHNLLARDKLVGIIDLGQDLEWAHMAHS